MTFLFWFSRQLICVALLIKSTLIRVLACTCMFLQLCWQWLVIKRYGFATYIVFSICIHTYHLINNGIFISTRTVAWTYYAEIQHIDWLIVFSSKCIETVLLVQIMCCLQLLLIYQVNEYVEYGCFLFHRVLIFLLWLNQIHWNWPIRNLLLWSNQT